MFVYFEWLVLAFPLLGALLNGCLGKRLSRRVQSWVACAAVLGSLSATLPLLIAQTMEPGLVGRTSPLPWIRVWSGSRFVEGPLALRTDTLSIAATFITLGGGLYIHLHTVRHLRRGASRHLVLSLLNGALSTLLIVVLADNYLFLLLGWSLAGWCMHGLAQNHQEASFPHEQERDVVEAGNLGAPMPRLSTPVSFLVSSLCLLLAVGLMSERFVSLSLGHVISVMSATVVTGSAPDALSAIVILLFLSAMARAAQPPFELWVPGRIANTFLYALSSILPGVYLLARLYPLVDWVPFGQVLLFGWGASSALLMARFALTQSSVGWVIHLESFGHRVCDRWRTVFTQHLLGAASHTVEKAKARAARYTVGTAARLLGGTGEMRPSERVSSDSSYLYLLFVLLATTLIVAYLLLR